MCVCSALKSNWSWTRRWGRSVSSFFLSRQNMEEKYILFPRKFDIFSYFPCFQRLENRLVIFFIFSPFTCSISPWVFQPPLSLATVTNLHQIQVETFVIFDQATEKVKKWLLKLQHRLALLPSRPQSTERRPAPLKSDVAHFA